MNESHALRRLLRFLWQFRLWLLISLLCAFISVLFSVIAPLLIGRIIDGITSGTALHAVMRELVLLAALYLSYSLFNWGMMYASNRIAFVSSCVLRRQLEAKMEKLPVSFYDRHARGDLISRFINDIDFISDGFLQGLSTMLSGAATIVLTLVFMLRINWIMALIVTVSAPFTYLVARIIAVRTGRYFRAQANVLGRLNGYGEEMLSGIRTLKAYGYEDEAVRQFEQYDAQLYDAGVKAQFYGSLANPSTRFVMNTAYAAVGGAGALLALAGQITIGSISSFLMYSNLFSKPFTEISGVMTQLQSAVSSAQRVFDLLDEPQEDADGEQVLQVREGRVDFLHVRFGYELGQPLMKDITLHVPAGSRVAIVGRTGAGKTTLVNLLMRFYEIEGGQILIDDQDIRRCTRDSLRRQFGMVLQDTCLFEGTIAENIAFGKPEASHREIEEAARRSGAHEFIRRLDKGYESLISADSDMLSQGQRQLLAITRVLLLDPRMLILDEATSSIDTLSERHVNQAMELLMKGRTSFIIAHRLSTITDADLILVMEQGDIVEQGTHEALLQADGAYAELFNSQFT